MQLLTVQLPKGQQDFYKKNISIIPMVYRSSKYHLQLWALNVRSFEWCAISVFRIAHKPFKQIKCRLIDAKYILVDTK